MKRSDNMLQIYCGEGKGKTTASLGLALRMAGAGMKVAFVQFMKGGDTAELSSLEKLDKIDVMRCDRDYGFFSTLSESDKSELTSCHNSLLEKSFSGSYDAVILDEFNFAYGHSLMNCVRAEELILGGKDSREVVITGRQPAQVFVDAADYISEIKCVRHPYQKGVTARKGIEY
ncbi:MAG: cob(I)yrinic acid a,c-diamide adenosyltransferase [Ruminiclostridium sp.]|nr:cob(I)yrinic acid a,c-diamide adenosyltransferase [Ruminiclostridium sp.]